MKEGDMLVKAYLTIDKCGRYWLCEPSDHDVHAVLVPERMVAFWKETEHAFERMQGTMQQMINANEK